VHLVGFYYTSIVECVDSDAGCYLLNYLRPCFTACVSRILTQVPL